MSKWRYDAGNLDWIEHEVPDGEEAPPFVIHRRRQYIRNYEMADLAMVRAEIGGFTTAAAKPRLRDRHFACSSQPLNYPYALRHAKGIPGVKDGTPLYASAKEVRETEAKARHAGEDIHYDR